jgi:predicted RNA binding protein YcfA (HicA-like mRNA interferase family)
MPKIPGVSYLACVRALRKAGFFVIHEGKHTVMSNSRARVTIPRHNPINAYTMGGIARDAGFAPEEFRNLL